MDLEALVKGGISRDQSDINIILLNEIISLRNDIEILTAKIYKLEIGESTHEYREPILHRVICNGTLHVRASGSANSAKVGILRDNDIVYVYRKDNNWCQIDKKGERWCHRDYLEPVIIK